VADIVADTDPTRKAVLAECKALVREAANELKLKDPPSIPIDRPISWEDWERGRRARRETSKQAAPGMLT